MAEAPPRVKRVVVHDTKCKSQERGTVLVDGFCPACRITPGIEWTKIILRCSKHEVILDKHGRCSQCKLVLDTADVDS